MISFYYSNTAILFPMASVKVAFNELQQDVSIIPASLIYISHIYWPLVCFAGSSKILANEYKKTPQKNTTVRGLCLE